MSTESQRLIKASEYIDSHSYLKRSLVILKTCRNLRLVGETGTGKTTLVHAIAHALKTPLFEKVLSRDISKLDLLACDTLHKGDTQTREGIILKWLKAKEGILYLDGFNYAEPSIIALIESLADFRESIYIEETESTWTRSEKHFIVISYNPSEKNGYSGTNIENIATIRRFEGLRIDYLEAKEETQLIKKFSQDYEFASKFVELANKTRTLYRRGELRCPLTTGNVLNYAKLFREGLSEEEIIEIASSLFTEEQTEIFARLFEKCTGALKIEENEKKSTD